MAFNGKFIGTRKQVWANGKFKKNYRKFHARISTPGSPRPDLHARIIASMPPNQTPNYDRVGTPNPAFEAETPFRI